MTSLGTSTSVADMFVLVCPLDMCELINESISVKGWLEDHDFALGKGHGKKDLGPGSGAGSRADCWPPGGRLVNWVPLLFYKCSFKYCFLLLEAYHTSENILFAANIYLGGYSC